MLKLKIQVIFPIIGKHSGIIVRVDGGVEGLPETVKIKGKVPSVFLCPERPDELLESIGEFHPWSDSGLHCTTVDKTVKEKDLTLEGRCDEGEGGADRVVAYFGEKNEQGVPFIEEVDLGDGELRRGRRHVVGAESRGDLIVELDAQLSNPFNVQPNNSTSCPTDSNGSGANIIDGVHWVDQGAVVLENNLRLCR